MISQWMFSSLLLHHSYILLFQISTDSTNRVLKARKMLEEIVAENKGERIDNYRNISFNSF